MTEPRPEWPGFVAEPCTECGCPGGHHQPRCMSIVGSGDGRRHCGCPAYQSSTPQQIGLIDEPPQQEVT